MGLIRRQFTGITTAPTPPVDPGDRTVLQASDFTYLGAYKLPRQIGSGGETSYGNGLTLRYEAGVPHLLSSTGLSTGGDTETFEWADITPVIVTGPDDPLDPDEYPTATIAKEYGDVGGGKRVTRNSVGTVIPHQAGGDAGHGLLWDPVDLRLYWIYGIAYGGNGSEEDNWHIGYSTLNYAAGTYVAHGPWRMTGQYWKAAMTGALLVPQAFADLYLSGRRIAVGFGGYESLVGVSDASLGPSLTAITDPSLTAESGTISNVALLGYWPYQASPGAARDRMTRPLGTPPVVATGYAVDSWPLTKLSWQDKPFGGVWIETDSKHGVVFINQLAQGYMQYVSSQVPFEGARHYRCIYDPADLALVQTGGLARYDPQPTVALVTYPTTDYAGTGFSPATPVAVSSLVSNASLLKNDLSAGCVVTTTGAHGLGSSYNYVAIHGATDSAYNGLWSFTVVNTTSLRIYNTTFATNWPGGTAAGTITVSGVQTSTVGQRIGMAYDPLTRKLYEALAPVKGTNGSNSHCFIHVWQVAN